MDGVLEIFAGGGWGIEEPGNPAGRGGGGVPSIGSVGLT